MLSIYCSSLLQHNNKLITLISWLLLAMIFFGYICERLADPPNIVEMVLLLVKINTKIIMLRDLHFVTFNDLLN